MKDSSVENNQSTESTDSRLEWQSPEFTKESIDNTRTTINGSGADSGIYS
ncbi:Uncharacterised protein [BD1-7 clade bacterium]|uniref:Uncharacterized protein n=1 Tax=BD1-7 clade bacterium TaxID=2029982 RepID=A0A5S9PJJ4_9GAMM|nr:Uncharacterised protein [BD1-7 clade bacterium]